jgi:hypothetical protein
MSNPTRCLLATITRLSRTVSFEAATSSHFVLVLIRGLFEALRRIEVVGSDDLYRMYRERKKKRDFDTTIADTKRTLAYDK